MNKLTGPIDELGNGIFGIEVNDVYEVGRLGGHEIAGRLVRIDHARRGRCTLARLVVTGHLRALAETYGATAHAPLALGTLPLAPKTHHNFHFNHDAFYR